MLHFAIGYFVHFKYIFLRNLQTFCQMDSCTNLFLKIKLEQWGQWGIISKTIGDFFSLSVGLFVWYCDLNGLGFGFQNIFVLLMAHNLLDVIILVNHSIFPIFIIHLQFWGWIIINRKTCSTFNKPSQLIDWCDYNVFILCNC